MNTLNEAKDRYLRETIDRMVRQVLSEMANNNMTFGEFKRDMKNIGYEWEKLTRGSAWMFRLIVPYNNQTGAIQVDAHNNGSEIDGNVLRMVVKTLNEIGWFNNPNNYTIFPFDKWQISRKDIELDTTQQEIEKANELYKDAEIEQVFPMKNSVCVLKTTKGINLCRGINDKRPLLSDWFEKYEGDKIHGIPCLKRDNMETFETECYPIKQDGTLDIENMIIESKRYGKNRIK